MVKQLTTPIFDNGVTNSWRIQLSRALHSDPSSEEAINLALGRKPDQASQLLVENLAISGAPRFETSPTWWPVIPFISIRVDVISTESPQPSNPDGAEGLE